MRGPLGRDLSVISGNLERSSSIYENGNVNYLPAMRYISPQTTSKAFLGTENIITILLYMFYSGLLHSCH